MDPEIEVLAQSIFKGRSSEEGPSSGSQFQELLTQSIAKVNEQKGDLKVFSSFILTGGNTCLKNFVSNASEVVGQVTAEEKLQSRFFVYPTEKVRTLSSWIGGSIFGSIDNYQQFYITKEEFKEYGDSICDRKLI